MPPASVQACAPRCFAQQRSAAEERSRGARQRSAAEAAGQESGQAGRAGFRV